MFPLLSKYKSILLSGLCMALLLFAMRWLELRYLIFNLKFEFLVLATALIFMGLGVWLTLKLAKPKKETLIVDKEIYIVRDKELPVAKDNAQDIGISNRELEVLQLMAGGLSNAEIAEKLFISLNTVKTHLSKIFEKLEVKRRTQAVEKAKRLGIIP
jgi:ATP/maltotriose-dependent transcriptional regulator MalT